MSQITSGVRAILSSPFVYQLFQSLMGRRKARETFVQDYIKPEPGMNMLDIGCGPAAILEYLPSVNYLGFDSSQAYIDKAREKYGKRGQFYCRQVEGQTLIDLPKFDRVLALGVLHHLDDVSAESLVDLAFNALGSGGVSGYDRSMLRARSKPDSPFPNQQGSRPACAQQNGLRRAREFSF